VSEYCNILSIDDEMPILICPGNMPSNLLAKKTVNTNKNQNLRQIPAININAKGQHVVKDLYFLQR